MKKENKQIDEHIHCPSCGSVLEIIKQVYGDEQDVIFFTIYFCENCGTVFTKKTSKEYSYGCLHEMIIKR